MSVSCMCKNEYEWVFDMSPWTRHSFSPQRSTWVTMMVKIHPLGDGWDSWDFTLPRPPGWMKEPNRKWSYFFSAWALDVSGASLKVTVIGGEDEESVTVYFGARRGDGYEFAVKWFQENIPDIDLETGILTAEWSWEDDAVHPHIVHVWFPQGYALSVVAKKTAPSAANSQNLTTSSATQKEPMPLILGQTALTNAIVTIVAGVVGSIIYLGVRRRNRIRRASSTPTATS
jgi:hypothetical protein